MLINHLYFLSYLIFAPNNKRSKTKNDKNGAYYFYTVSIFPLRS